VGADGSQIGIVSTQEALRQAQELDLDLVEVAPQANPPVARIMDYGKFKYERDIRQKEARKKQVRVEVKEIKFRPKIDRHDYDTKKGHVIRFLSAGARVKVTIMFRGREMAHTDLGRKILDRLVEDLGDTAVVEAQPKQDGRNMVMVIGPTKKAMEQRAEASRRGPGPAEAPSPEPVEEPSVPDAVDDAPDVEEAPDAVEEAAALEQPEAPGSVEGPQPATR
jgi:translation initiation factor IF-3